MRKDIWVYLALFGLGVILGVNWNDGKHNNIWDKDRGGLEKLNEMMKNDKSDRLAMVVVTQTNQYVISAMDQKFMVQARIIEKGAT